MRVIEGENELRLTCSRSASGGIALLRCETQDDIVRLPDEIDGVPVTEVGAKGAACRMTSRRLMQFIRAPPPNSLTESVSSMRSRFRQL